MATIASTIDTLHETTDAQHASPARVGTGDAIEREELGRALRAVSSHLDDALDMLGARASGLSMRSAQRWVAASLPLLGAAARSAATDPLRAMPMQVMPAVGRLRSAEQLLAAMATEFLAIVPYSQSDRVAPARDLRIWSQDARELAASCDGQ